MTQIFEKICYNCKNKKTIWKLLQVSRVRGLKIICLGCMKTRWFNYDKIKKYEVKNEKNIC